MDAQDQWIGVSEPRAAERNDALAARTPPRVRITGPAARLPQWPGGPDLERFQISSGVAT